MAHIIEQNMPLGGMDMDSSDLAINHTAGNERKPIQDYRYARNIRTAISSAKRGKALTNVLSNLQVEKYILPYTGGEWPTGQNRCVGAYEDVVGKTVIFFVWNSEGRHQILQYFRDLTDPNNPLGQIQQIMCFSGWNWTKATRITSINLVYGQPSQGNETKQLPGNILYWCDPVPHEIDITMANICAKQKSYVLYPGYSFKTFSVPSTFNFQLATYQAQIILNLSVPIPVFNDPDISIQQNNANGLEYLADQINALAGGMITAEACGCALTITESVSIAPQSFYYASSGPALKLYAENWYGAFLIDRYFDRCMWQPMNVPQGTYKANTNYLPNNVQNRVFQFRLLYTYRCGSPSAPGIYSQIPTNNLQCDGTNNPLLNYIDVNFNDVSLIDNSTLVIFNQIWFIARQLGNGTVGSVDTQADKIIKQLYPCDFLDFNGQSWFCHYEFYNNIDSIPLDVTTAQQLYDDVPLESGAEIETQNRMVEGNVLVGLNGPDCTSAGYKIKIKAIEPKKQYKITFKIRVWSPALFLNPQFVGSNNTFTSIYQQLQKRPFWQSDNADINYSIERGIIGHDTTRTENDFAYYGGGGFRGNSAGQFGIRAGMEDVYDQRLPEGGWPVYFAGTPFFGISKQVNIGLPTDGVGGLDTSTDAFRENIGTYLIAGSNNDLYSTVTIIAPAGEYVVRVGSHWCSVGDELGKGFAYDLNGSAWRNTSANVFGVYAGGNGQVPMYTPGAWQFSKEIRINVTGDNDDAGTFVIADLAPPFFTRTEDTTWIPLNAYLVDDSNGTTVISDPNAPQFNGVAVEKAMVSYEAQPLNPYSGLGSFCVSDHNGYIFGIGSLSTQHGELFNGFQFGAWQINNQQISFDNTTVWKGSVTDYYNKQLSGFDYTNSQESALQFGFITTDLVNARTQCSTNIEGFVKDQNGDPIPNVLVVYEHTGEMIKTDVNGKYVIRAWGDMVTANIPNFAPGTLPVGAVLIAGTNRVVDSLIFSISPSCVGTYPSGQSYGPIPLTPINTNPAEQSNTPPYSPTSIFTSVDFIINETVYAISKKLKRGGKYLCGIRYNDNPGRLCTVTELFEIYIPFPTEDLSLYPYVVDSNDNPYPAGTFIDGQPDILWFFNNTFKPPVYAVSYNLMRSKDTFYSKYLRWTITGAQYVSMLANPLLSQPVVNTAYRNGDAVAVLLDISNISIYGSQNPGSQVGYTWTEGDRVRLLLDRDNVLLHSPSANLGQTGTMLDYPITGTYSPPEGNPGQLIVPIPNLPFEIKSGYTVEIYTPKTVENVQNQLLFEVGEKFNCTDPGNPNNQHGALSGTFTNGDTYWRGRIVTVADNITGYTAVYPQNVEDQSVSDYYPSKADDTGRVGIIDPTFVQLRRPTALISSGKYLPGTAVNGLSTFNLNLSEEAEIDRRYGEIMRLFYEMNVLQVVCNGKDVSAPVDRTVMYEAQSGTGVVGLNGDFFNQQNFYIHAKNLGTDFSGSCATNSGLIFGFNNYKCNTWRWQGNGESVTSDNKMITFFQQLQQDGVTDVISAYDRYYEEWVLTYWRKYTITNNISTIGFSGNAARVVMPYIGVTPAIGTDVALQYTNNGVSGLLIGTISAVTGTTITIAIPLENILSPSGNLPVVKGQLITASFSIPETILWCEGTDEMKAQGEGQVWRGFLDNTPEMWCSLGSDMCSFIDGKIWITTGQGVTPDTQRNTFYNSRYNSVITPVFNGGAPGHNSLNKLWNALWLKGTQGIQRGGGYKGTNNWFSNPEAGAGITNMYGQLSRLSAANWLFNENNWATDFKRDMNDISKPLDPPPNIFGTRVLNGMELRSEALTVELQNDYPGEIVLYSLGGNYTLSERTGK